MHFTVFRLFALPGESNAKMLQDGTLLYRLACAISNMNNIGGCMHLDREVAGDMAQERLRIDKDVPQGEGIDAQRQVADVHELYAQRCGQPQLPQSSCLVAGRCLGDQRQIAQNALQAHTIHSWTLQRTDNPVFAE